MSVVVAVSSGALGFPAMTFAADVHTATAQVGGGSSLNVRGGPSTASQVVGKIGNGTKLVVACQVLGQTITGSVTRTAVWDRLGDHRYVSDGYVNWPGGRPAIDTCVVGGHAVTSSGLNVRPNASTLVSPVDRLHAGRSIRVVCQLGGEPIRGDFGTSAVWDQLATGRYVADTFVRWVGGRPDVPWCSFATSGTPATGEPFVAWAASLAQQMKAIYRVPAAVTIAQAILESGWGRSGLTVDGNNYFGMKCFDSPGSNAAGCRPYATQECAGTACYPTDASFRVYDSALESFQDHAHSLASLPRYHAAFSHSDPDQFATAIADAGYATSPTYAHDLIDLMHGYDLYRFDARH
jgi:uncharacterized protein YraI